jgi:type II secretory pathway pseudopilin PulG
MTRSRSQRGYVIVDALVGIALFGIVILSIYQVFVMAFGLAQRTDDRLLVQQDVRLALDRMARVLHETTLAPGRLRIYPAEAGCTGQYDGCIGFVTARDANCGGLFHLINGSPQWQATIYLWRDAASNELRSRCDPSTTFPAGDWPPPALTPHTVIGTRVVGASFTLQPPGNAAPSAVAVMLHERVPGASPRPQGDVYLQTVIVPENR